MSLVGQVAVVTGAAKGIGRACAVRLAQDGADVAILDIDDAALAETEALVEAEGHRSEAIALDLTDRDQVAAAFDRVKATLGPINVLHSNAGGGAGVRPRTFAKASEEQWDKTLALNLTQNIDCVRQVIPGMIEAGYGRIVITSSEMAFRSGFAMAEYAAAKAGILGFVRNLANEVGKYGVTVNAVCPGPIRTELALALPEEHRARTLAQVPVGRLGEPEEIAHAVSFLASPGASYVTGESLLVTGGRTLH